MKGLGRLAGAVVTTTVVVGLTRASQRKRPSVQHGAGHGNNAGHGNVDSPEATSGVQVAASDAIHTDTAVRPRRAVVASRISYLATAALVVVLVIWGTGGFDVGGQMQSVSAADSAQLQNLPEAAVAVSPEGRGAAATTGQEAETDVLRSTSRASDEPSVTPAVEDVQRANPVSVHIPAIGVNASVIGLGTEPDGALQVPADFSQTGWWTGGPEPGEPGPAVVVGHVDSYVGPAVFYDLRNLADGDRINIARSDGSAAVFEVRGSVQALKAAFPTDAVYGSTQDPQLRLITCDGDFANGSYLGNLIVTAELVRETSPPSRGVAT